MTVAVLSSHSDRNMLKPKGLALYVARKSSRRKPSRDVSYFFRSASTSKTLLSSCYMIHIESRWYGDPSWLKGGSQGAAIFSLCLDASRLSEMFLVRQFIGTLAARK